MLNKMFANLKSKIKEETGNDVSKLTSVWGDKTKIRESTTSVLLTASGAGDNSSANEITDIPEQKSTYDTDHEACKSLMDQKLKEKEHYWKVKFDDLQMALDATQGEEVRAAVAVARTTQAELAQLTSKLTASEHQLIKLRDQANCALQLQEKLENLLEEYDTSRREWSKERAELRTSLGAAEAEVGILRDELALVRAALPPSHPDYKFDDIISSDVSNVTEDLNRLWRERAVLERQLQETRVALADIKTSWSGQIASLETQVARLSLQAGEEGAERRRAVLERDGLQKQLANIKEEASRHQKQLVNSDAKEVAKQRDMQLKAHSLEILRLQETLKDRSKDLHYFESQMEEQRTVLQEITTEKESLISLLQLAKNDYKELQKQYDVLSRDKDDALLRNAHISQSLELSHCDIRDQENEMDELRDKIVSLEKNIQMLKEEIHKTIESRELLQVSEKTSKDKIRQLEYQLDEKNKNVKALQNRMSDMKKTLQQEIQNSRSELSTTEDSDISRRYLKHVVMRFLTAKELEARQLTRALSVLLRLSPQEEALLQSALPSRNGITNWFSGLPTT